MQFKKPLTYHAELAEGTLAKSYSHTPAARRAREKNMLAELVRLMD